MNDASALFGGIVGLILFFVAALLAVFWLIFPWFVYYNLKKLVAQQEKASAERAEIVAAIKGTSVNFERLVLELRALKADEPSRAQPAAEDAYWIRIGDDTNGPFPIAKVRELKTRGMITDETPVAAQGSTEWKPASSVIG